MKVLGLFLAVVTFATLVSCSGVTPSVRVAYLHTSVKEEYVYATPTDDDYVGPATILDHTERSGYGVGGALQLEFAEDGTIVTPCVLGQYIGGKTEFKLGMDDINDTETTSTSSVVPAELCVGFDIVELSK